MSGTRTESFPIHGREPNARELDSPTKAGFAALPAARWSRWVDRQTGTLPKTVGQTTEPNRAAVSTTVTKQSFRKCVSQSESLRIGTCIGTFVLISQIEYKQGVYKVLN